MNKKRGQALVEFIIILPIFIFMLLGIFDIGKIFYFRNQLETTLEDVVLMYENDQNIADLKNITVNVEENGDYTNIELTRKIDIITPGLNLIFKSPYEITTKRVINNG